MGIQDRGLAPQKGSQQARFAVGEMSAGWWGGPWHSSLSSFGFDQGQWV